MFNGERSKNESFEEEKSPEQVVSNAVSTVENKDAIDSVISSEWTSKAKGYAKTSGEIAGVSLGVSLILTAKTLLGILKFTKKAIQKKGQIGFGEGYEIGKEIFSNENKKDKK